MRPHGPRTASARQSVATLLALLAPPFGLAGCEPLPELVAGCGDSVVEPERGEACEPAAAAGATCGAPGTAGECRFLCAPANPAAAQGCPSGDECGTDGICRTPRGAWGAPIAIGGGADELLTGDFDGDRRDDVIATSDRDIVVSFGAEGALASGKPGFVGAGAAPSLVRRQIAYEPLLLPLLVARDGSEVGGVATGADLLIPRFGFASMRADGSGDDRTLRAAELPSLRAPSGVEDFRLLTADCPASKSDGDLLLHATLEIPVLGPMSVLAYAPNYGFAVVGRTIAGPAALARPALAERFGAADPSKTCRQLVLGYSGDSRLEVFQPFFYAEGPDPSEEDDEWVTVTCGGPLLDRCPAEVRQELDVGAPVVAGPYAGHFNPEVDDLLDLVVQVPAPARWDCEPCYELRVAYGLANGSFDSSPSHDPAADPPEQGDGRFSLLARPESEHDGELLLALGHLGGDARSDFVWSGGATLAGDQQKGSEVLDNIGASWSEAVVADMNGDGLDDVLAVDGTTPVAFYFNGVGSDVLSSFDIPTEGPLRQLATGDFDGDAITDALGVTSRLDETLCGGSTGAVSHVSILFGAPSGPPEPPASIGYACQDLWLTAGRMASDQLLSFAGVRDGAWDILAVGSDPFGNRAISVFVGRGDRELRAPLGLVQVRDETIFDVEIVPYLPRRGAVGHFGSGSDQGAGATAWRIATLAAVVTNDRRGDPFQLWLLPELGSGLDLRALSLVAEPIQRETESAWPAVWEAGMVAAIDLDGDSVDEVVALAPLANDPIRSAYRIAHYDQASSAWRWVPEADASPLDISAYRDSGPTIPCRNPYASPADEPLPECEQIDLEDFTLAVLDFPPVNGRLLACNVLPDADGRDDLVLLSRPAVHEGDAAQAAVQGSLYAYQSDGSLELRADGFTAVGGLSGMRLFDVGCMQADGDAELELAVLSEEGLWLVDWRDSGLVPTPLAVEALPPAATRLAVGDFDGDGLDDLVLADPGQTVVVPAVDPLDAARSGR